jgi:hypothetical protein
VHLDPVNLHFSANFVNKALAKSVNVFFFNLRCLYGVDTKDFFHH